MLETKLSTDYQVYEKDAMASKESVASHALEVKRLFATGSEEIYVFELGIHVIIILCFSIVALKRLREDLRKQYIFCLIAGLICVLMSTKLWPWKLMPEFLNIIQFPWRMLSIAGFFLSFVCGVNMAVTLRWFNIKDVIIISAICIAYVCALYNFIPFTEKVYNIQDYSLGIMSGKDVEVVAGTGKAEYLPKKAFDNRFYIATREDATYVLSGKAIIESEEKQGSFYKAKIQTVKEKTVFELPYIYYPGYQVRADGMILDNFETENGFLGITLEADEDIELEVKYTGTRIMKITMLISLVSSTIFAVYVWKKH